MIRSVWALVISFVAEAAILCLLSYALVPFLPRFGIDRKSLSELLRFVLGLFGSPIFAMIVFQADVLFLAKMVTEGRLGMYSLALHLAYLPAIMTDRIIRPVLLPAFSEKQDDKDSLRWALLKISRWEAVFGASLVAFMASCASGILLLAYGPKYAAIAVPFTVLSICAFIRIQSGIFVAAYMALGQPHLHRRFKALQAAIVVVLMYPAIVKFDLTGAAGVILMANIVTLCFQVLFMKRLVGLEFLEYIFCWLPGLLACSIVFGSAALLQLFGVQSDVCNVTIVGLSCIAACAFVLLSTKSNARAACRSRGNIEKLKSVSSV